VALSADGSTVAAGAIYHGSNGGHVRVYRYSAGAWLQYGTDIDDSAGVESVRLSLSAYVSRSR
jgi:hypothetical protein